MDFLCKSCSEAVHVDGRAGPRTATKRLKSIGKDELKNLMQSLLESPQPIMEIESKEGEAGQRGGLKIWIGRTPVLLHIRF